MKRRNPQNELPYIPVEEIPVGINPRYSTNVIIRQSRRMGIIAILAIRPALCNTTGPKRISSNRNATTMLMRHPMTE